MPYLQVGEEEGPCHPTITIPTCPTYQPLTYLRAP